MAKPNKSIVYGALSGLLLALSQPIYGLSILVFAGLVPVFYCLKKDPPAGGKSSKSFLLGFAAGLVYFLFALKWFWSAFPLKNIGVDSGLLAFLSLLLIWLLTAAVLALTWGAVAWLWKKTDPKISRPALLIFPAVWTVGEYLRSYLISLLWVGRDNPIGPHWTVGNLAYNLHNSFLAVKVSSWLGIYGIGFLIVCANVLLFSFFEERKFKKLILAAAITIAAVLMPWQKLLPQISASQEKNLTRIKIAAVQTKIPSQPSYSGTELASSFKTQLTLLNSVANVAPDAKVVLFPEGSNFFQNLSLFQNTLGVSQYFNRLFPSSTTVIDNSKIHAGEKFQSKSIFLDSKEGVVSTYDKYLLMPGGEYVPKLLKLADKVLGLNSEALKQAEEFESGDAPSAVSLSQEISAGVLACSDVSSPNISRSIVLSGANLLFSQSSMGFVSGSKDLIRQDLAFSQFRAAENQKYLVKASNYGNSYIISDQGLVLKKTENLEPQILTGSVVLNNGKTLYNKAGDGPILLASLGVLVIGFFLREKKS